MQNAGVNCFELLSGLKIIFDKSSLYGFRTDEADLNYWASRIRCKVGCLPIGYLGVPLGLNPQRRQFWLPVIDRMKTNLSRLKSQSLKPGREVSFT